MLADPNLQYLSHDDMVQRYRDSFIHYKGEVWYVSGISEDNAFLIKNKGRKEELAPLDWSKVNIERPKSGWYIYKDSKDKLVCQYFRLTTKKQYHRGLTTDGNYTVFTPNLNKQGLINKYDLLNAAFKGPDPKKEVISWDNLVTELFKGEYFFRLQPQMVATMQGEVLRVYYRTQELITLDLESNQLFGPNTVTFKDEINESIVSFPWDKVHIPKKVFNLTYPTPEEYEALKRPNLKAILNKIEKERVEKMEAPRARPQDLQFFVNPFQEEAENHPDNPDNWDEGPQPEQDEIEP